LQSCTCRSKSPGKAIDDERCPLEVAATAEAEPMRMIAETIRIAVARSDDNVSITGAGQFPGAENAELQPLERELYQSEMTGYQK
jgi:hypothetical protein